MSLCCLPGEPGEPGEPDSRASRAHQVLPSIPWQSPLDLTLARSLSHVNVISYIVSALAPLRGNRPLGHQSSERLLGIAIGQNIHQGDHSSLSLRTHPLFYRRISLSLKPVHNTCTPYKPKPAHYKS